MDNIREDQNNYTDSEEQEREIDCDSYRPMIAKVAPEQSTLIFRLIKKAPKLFIGGISPLTTDETLRNYFLQFGEIIDCTIMLDKNTSNFLEN